MTNVAIYVRVSTDEQSIDRQLDDIERWLANNSEYKNFNKIIYNDRGISGSTDDRPEFVRMLHDAKNGLFSAVIVHALDRFSRSASSALRNILALEALGVDFISITQPVLCLGKSNPFRRTLLAAFSEIAEVERELIKARIMSGIAAAKRRGVRFGRPRTIDAKTRAEVKQMRKNGLKLHTIAYDLDISKASVARILAGK